MVLVLTITTAACSSAKPTNSSNGSITTPPQTSNNNNEPGSSSTAKPPTSSQPGSSSTAKPPTNSQPSSSPAVKASSKITSGDQAGELVKKTIFNNNDGIVMAYNDVESYNGFQCYPVKASSKSMQANGGSGTIGTYDVEIESGRIWDLSTNKIAIPN